jgi:transcriptional regulator with XRE-family HTH domain
MSTARASKFGANLRRARQARDWSQDDLGRRIGLKSGMSISHYETGQREPTLRTLARLAHALEVPADVLLAEVPTHERRIRWRGRRRGDL